MQTAAATLFSLRRQWIFHELCRHFAHVYMPSTQPWHREFPLDWTALSGDGVPGSDLTRAVLARGRIWRHRWQTDATRRCSLCFSTASTFASPSSGRRSNGRISADAVAAIIWPRATASSWLGTVAAVAAGFALLSVSRSPRRPSLLGALASTIRYGCQSRQLT